MLTYIFSEWNSWVSPKMRCRKAIKELNKQQFHCSDIPALHRVIIITTTQADVILLYNEEEGKASQWLNQTIMF